MGIKGIDALKIGHSTIWGKEHSLLDKNCTCDVWHDPFPERVNCPANTKVNADMNSSIGFSFGAYLLFEAEVSAEIDLETLRDDIIKVFKEEF